MNKLTLIALIVVSQLLLACSTTQCKRQAAPKSAFEAAAAAVAPAAQRVPASGCQIMLPFIHKVHGKIGSHRIHADEAVQTKLKSKGYSVLDPADHSGGTAAYLEKIPVGSYGLIIDSFTSFGSSGWASALFVIRAPENYEILKVLRAEVGGQDAILLMLDQLPNCH